MRDRFVGRELSFTGSVARFGEKAVSGSRALVTADTTKEVSPREPRVMPPGETCVTLLLEISHIYERDMGFLGHSSNLAQPSHSCAVVAHCGNEAVRGIRVLMGA